MARLTFEEFLKKELVGKEWLRDSAVFVGCAYEMWLAKEKITNG